ncbi:MAG TPA: LLM class F420-dependent oxidoreductase [Methylomirabilota bacterium]|jgi:probable F420-dependent oxidoreductase|nr:LLM class F420-dependent oxidoreductase [Methylomirabilota bacterium]
MADFGLVTIPTHYTIQPGELARWAEEQGFESIFFGEHTHIPTSRKTPFPLGGELPAYYKEFFDPFIALTAAAAVTQKLKVGTSVCLVPEHHPITLAKTIACLDRVSNGRFLFGIGAGWNVEEMADHGVAFQDRWKVTRERVLAMREIWSKEVAEFHGQFVNFDPLWCWPKPVQAGGPPVLLGAMSKWAARRIVEYCDGWIPLDGGYDLVRGIAALREEAERKGRSMKEFDLSVITGYELAGARGTESRVRELMQMGFNRVLFLIEPGTPEKQWPSLERYATLIRQFR